MLFYVDICCHKVNSLLQKFSRLYTSVFFIIQDCSYEDVKRAVLNCSWMYMKCLDGESMTKMSGPRPAGAWTQLLGRPSSRIAIIVYLAWVRNEIAYWYNRLQSGSGGTESYVKYNTISFYTGHFDSLFKVLQSGFFLKYGPRLLSLLVSEG